MTRLTLFRLAVGLSLGLCACGGNDKPSTGGTAGTGGKGSAAGSGGGAGGSTGTGTGSGKEGDDCTGDTDCSKGLNCIVADSITVSGRDVPISVCARKCSVDSDCMDSEMCFSTTGKGENLMCWSLTTEAEPCGPAATSFCDESANLQCLVTASSTTGSIAGGQCVQLCDASNACPSNLSCLGNSDGTGGVCGKQLNRGDSCVADPLSDCADADVCITDGTDGFCLQDCTQSMKCDDSNQKCMPLSDGSGSFCM